MDIREELEHFQGRVRNLVAKGEALDLTMINPDIPPPRYCLDKLAEQVVKPQLHRYAVARGVERLRAAAAQKYQNRFDISLDHQNEICITAGSKDALLCALRVMAKEGERVLLPNPCYPAFVSSAELLGLKIDFYSLDGDYNQILDSIRLKAVSERYAVVVCNFPNNPTGKAVPQEFYDGLILLAERYEFLVINDFVWGEIPLEGVYPSVLVSDPARERAVELYSLSKAYSVPGWRVGMLCGPGWVVARVTRLKQQLDYGISLPVQYAAASVLSNTENITKPILEEYRRRYSLFSQGLEQSGWRIERGQVGAFVWAQAPQAVMSKVESGAGDKSSCCLLVDYLLENAGVAALPGAAFYVKEKDYVRFALVKPVDELQNALERLSRV